MKSGAPSGRHSASQNDEVINQIRIPVTRNRCITIGEFVDNVEKALVRYISLWMRLGHAAGVFEIRAKATMGQKQLRWSVAGHADCSNGKSDFLNAVIYF